MEIMIQAGVILLSLFFLFLLFMCIKTWRWFHVLMALCVFGAAIPLVAYTTMVLKTRRAWLQYYVFYTEKLDEVTAEEKRVVWGDPEAFIQTQPCLIDVKEELARWLYDRGRMWRNTRPSPQGKGVARVLLYSAPPAPDPAAPADPADPAAPAPAGPQNLIEANSIVYVFLERALAEGGEKVPATYLGEFRTTAVTDNSITIEPTLPLDPSQQRFVNNAQPADTWTIYEMMPLDGHNIFEGPDMQADAVKQYIPTQQQLARMLPKSLFTELDADKKLVEISDAEYQQVIADIHTEWTVDYMYDGREITDIQAAFPGFEPPPDQVFREVQFEREHTISVDANEGAQDVHDRNAFDSQGQALQSELKQGEQTTFEIGDTWICPDETAKDLISRGIAKQGAKKIYRRKLSDFGQALHELHRRQQRTDKSIIDIGIETVAVNKTLAELKGPDGVSGQIKIKSDEVEKLREDLANFKTERDEITKYRAELERRLAAERAALSLLYRTNIALEDQLETLQKQAADQINRRGEQAVPTAAPNEL